MIAVDTNILIHAHREESEKHDKALSRITKLAEGPNVWCIPVFCISEFLRVITHPRVFNPPHKPTEACDSISNLLASPTLKILKPGDQFERIFLNLVSTLKLKGNHIFDAQIAAVCIENAVFNILTEDSDFKIFDRIKSEKL